MRFPPAYMLSILRIMTALLFLEHGTSKLLSFPPDPAAMHPALATMAGLSGVLELIGGALLVLGLFTRIVAFLLSGEMAVAYFMVHWAIFSKTPHSFYPIINHGELAIIYCFVFLYLSVAGGGALALDSMMGGRSSRSR